MNKLVPNYGPADARIIVVGEAPGAIEEQEGKPFQGPAGLLLRGALAAVGIDPEQDVFYANLCPERPPSNELRAFFDKHGAPNATVIQGLTALKADIERINPNLIIPVGNYPLKFLTGRGKWSNEGYTGISIYRGSILEGTPFAGGRKCLPTYHPAAALRQYLFKHIIKSDLARAATQRDFPEIRRPRKYLLQDPRGADREAWRAWMVSPEGTLSPKFELAPGEFVQVPSGPFLSADIEYIGSKLLCLGCTRHADVAVSFATRDPFDIDFIRGILLSGIPLCFQNAMFDCSILEWFYDIPCLQYLKHDTMVAMHCAYTEFPKDLGFIGSLFTEQPVWFEAPDPANPGRFVIVDSKFWKGVAAAIGTQGLDYYERIYLPYNCTDVWVTHSAMEQMLADELTDPAVLNTYQHEMALIQPLWSISKRGVKIDVPALDALKTKLQAEAVSLLSGIKHYAGKEVKVKAPKQVATFLYDIMKVPQAGGKTPGGQWKMDDSTLAALSMRCKDEKQRTAIRMVREARERLDLVSKFCEIELDTDGRMRCHYDPAKTETGRLSSRIFYPTGRGANLQNMPRDTHGRSPRSVFIPDKGMIFGYADLKSAESLIVAHLTGDPEMLKLHSPEYLSGKLDGHIYVASFLLDKPQDKITKDERYLGKRVRHAGNYGLGWHKLMTMINADAQDTGVTVDAAQAKQLINKYRMFHPFLQTWWSDVQTQLYSTHTLSTLHGRKRVFYGRPDEMLPEAIAYVPQGTVAQTLNMGLLRVEPTFALPAYEASTSIEGSCNLNWMQRWDIQHLGLRPMLDLSLKSLALNTAGFEMLLQVHDAIGFQCPEKAADSVLPLVRQLMTIPIQVRRRGVEPYTITIPVEIQVGENWGEGDEDKVDPKTGVVKKAINPNGLKSWKEGK